MVGVPLPPRHITENYSFIHLNQNEAKLYHPFVPHITLPDTIRYAAAVGCDPAAFVINHIAVWSNFVLNTFYEHLYIYIHIFVFYSPSFSTATQLHFSILSDAKDRISHINSQFFFLVYLAHPSGTV